ncbi:nuclear transport factor 2 family protein [Streptomyces iconiensis]|uniref:Nuclear transport factor 2 family protein n=1 Tax=Streptomyces iconiensis TaxID=1384038 RepID=A0ABT7A0X8_9ACTN|nr:nuclear transport factor 2 family protein [Streptomyces iconiensis]MDJ1134993.1 nuclear transport factor 2 family protein [Streptomyces iconiensis]
MNHPSPARPGAVSAELYVSIQQFYAQHMQLLDSGKIDDWSAFFTEDGEYAANAHPVPVRGRVAIADRMRQTVSRLEEERGTRRHWVGMIQASWHGEEVRARSYALVLQSSTHGAPFIRATTTCEDTLVPDGTSWLVRRRFVQGDVPEEGGGA